MHVADPEESAAEEFVSEPNTSALLKLLLREKVPTRTEDHLRRWCVCPLPMRDGELLRRDGRGAN